MDSRTKTNISKCLSRVLRHQANNLGITMGRDGFVLLTDILAFLHRSHLPCTADIIKDIVQTCQKQRFQLTQKADHEWYIRASQGHSISTIDVEMLLTPITTPTGAFHGSYHNCLGSIISTGLNRMGRTHVR